jgi:hypothetical protein
MLAAQDGRPMFVAGHPSPSVMHPDRMPRGHENCGASGTQRDDVEDLIRDARTHAKIAATHGVTVSAVKRLIACVAVALAADSGRTC